jgi:hypothetical protein
MARMAGLEWRLANIGSSGKTVIVALPTCAHADRTSLIDSRVRLRSTASGWRFPFHADAVRFQTNRQRSHLRTARTASPIARASPAPAMEASVEVQDAEQKI